MVYVLLAWLLPLIIVTVVLCTVKDENVTIGDALQMVGISLLPLVNWVLIYVILVELIKQNEEIQEFLNRKLK